MTNYEKIKNMDISELASFLDKNGFNIHCDGYICEEQSCANCCERWLNMEVLV